MNARAAAASRAGWPLIGGLVLASLLSPTTVGRADEPVTGNAPGSLEFPQPRHDFGRVNGGDTVTHRFAFTNPGPGPVEIRTVKSSCGCLEVGPWPTRVGGGQGGTIPVQFATANYSGEITETVTVTCADPAVPPLRLEVVAQVWWPLEITPRSAVFEFGRNSGSNAFTVVRLVNQEAAPLEIRTPIHSSHPALAATLRTNRAGREFELELRAVPPLPSGNLFGEVKLLTSSTAMPVVAISVAGLLQPDVVVAPSRLTLPAGGVTERLQQTVSIRSFWTNALELTTPVVSNARVAVQLRPAQPGREYDVVLTYPEGFAPAAGERLELQVGTNHPRFPRLRIPIVLPPATPVP